MVLGGNPTKVVKITEVKTTVFKIHTNTGIKISYKALAQLLVHNFLILFMKCQITPKSPSCYELRIMYVGVIFVFSIL